MKYKKFSLFKKLTLLLSLFMCIGQTSTYANEVNKINNSPNNVIYEKNATQADKDYVNLRDTLVEQYGVSRAYEMLGFQQVSTKTITATDITPYSTDPTIITLSKPQTVPKGTMKITIYKNLTNNTIDIWYEMMYGENQIAGKYGNPDTIAASFDEHDVYKVSTSYSSVITNYIPTGNGGYGNVINSTYARIVYTLKPNIIGNNVYDCHGGSIMAFGERVGSGKDNIQVSIGGDYITLSGGDFFTPYYLEYPGW